MLTIQGVDTVKELNTLPHGAELLEAPSGMTIEEVIRGMYDIFDFIYTVNNPPPENNRLLLGYLKNNRPGL